MGDVGSSADSGILNHIIANAEGWGEARVKEVIDMEGLKIPGHSFIVYDYNTTYESLSGGPKLYDIEKYHEGFDKGLVCLYRPAGQLRFLEQAVQITYNKYHDRGYGFLQTGLGMFLPLIWRHFFHKDAINLFPWGIICSELNLYYLREVRDLLSKANEVEDAMALAWAYRLDPQTTDPALILSCEIMDAVPEGVLMAQLIALREEFKRMKGVLP